MPAGSDQGGLRNRKPSESAFKQQKLPAWQPILTPRWVIGTFIVVAVVFIPIGIVILDASNKVQEYAIEYQDKCTDMVNGKSCTNNVTLSVTKDMKAPVYVYYELSNFYQNHRRYVQSRSDEQLRGSFGGSGSNVVSASDADSVIKSGCTPSNSREYNFNDKTYFYYPCGLIARSTFNDTYIFTQSANQQSVVVSETGIAWKSDIDKKFSQKSDDWMQNNCAFYGHSEAAFNQAGFDFTWAEAQTRAAAAQAKGAVFDCWRNVDDEHFIVWMRVAGLPTFKKLWGKIETDVAKGDYTVTINNNFPVTAFGGTKKVVLSTTEWIGGKNSFLGVAYLVVGGICAMLAVVFLIKELTSPRDLADARFMEWK